ncbi:MAG: beta-propeller domain-containing protein [Actinomycetota bacterium]|nr:beta-propeller domain-containing protein [Actinomycetota bacterium]
MNPGDRPRRALLTTIGAAVAIAAASTIAVAIDSEPASAGELERFASCEALADWGTDGTGGMERQAGGLATDDADAATAAPSNASGSPGVATGGAEGGQGTGGDMGADAAAPPAVEQSPASTTAELPRTDDENGTTEESARSSDAGEDGTNVIVEGVDELDVIDLLDRDHALVSAARRLSIVDLVDDQVVANLPVPSSAQITYDRENEIAWVVGPNDDDGRLTATRVAVTPASLTEDASWSTDGWLVDARRIGGRLHLVAADGYDFAVADVAREAAPFTDGPVACDQVLHPNGPSDPMATLLVTLPATGALEPEHATEVVGSGQLVHVTTEAAYLATPLYGNTVETGIHRFDLDTLTLTGSGRVAGTLLNQFAMSDHDGHLRVATTDPRGGFGMPIEGDMVVPEGGTTGAMRTTTAVEPPSALNEIVVLDTDGSLDEVGRTPRFGHPGETIHGVRFDGAIAYAVTFLQTDPFYVIDLADPTRPIVAGEVELPGFSSYLHPVGEGLVAGFGPDEDGKVAVKLFDVSNRAQPTVVDQLDLGDESPIAWDHHAFVDLGEGRFAVPASTYRQLRPAGCTPARQEALQAEVTAFEAEMGRLYQQPEMDPASSARANQLMERQAEIAREGCLYPNAVPESSVVVIDTTGGRLQLVQRLGAVRTTTSAARAVPTDDGWALLAGNRWVVLDGASGDQVADLELGPEEAAYPVDVGGGAAGRPGLVIE